jgi:hypothetical protein
MKRILLAACLFSGLTAVGQTYFQQKVDTRIEVRLDDKAHYLHGFEQFRYTNNAPDTLTYLYIHLWPNAYSSDRTRFTEQQVLNGNTAIYFSKQAERGYMDSLDFRVDGQQVSLNTTEGLPDIARIDLPVPLAPGQTVEVLTPFRVKIPKVFSRLGHSGQAYYISQWFPKPAVFDKKGWHPLPYTDQGEFFSEIGSYDVQITVPKNYVVMATGNCMDEAENAWLDSLSAAAQPASSLSTGTKSSRQRLNAFPVSSKETKTLHFHEDNVHDFAWFADKRYLVRKDTVRVPAGAGIPAHPVTVYAAFLPAEQKTWEKATEHMKRTILAYSEAIGPYPYNTVKAVEGDMKAGGGMEYPTITVIDRFASRSSISQVIVHEVGHNWFYGVLASNERDNAWMDEGFNTFYEQKVTREIRLADGKKDKESKRLEDALYYNAASTRTDQKLTNSSAAYTKGNYGLDVYYKTALLLNWMEAYLGKDQFRTAMHQYYEQWKFRHPYPEDVQKVFEQSANKPVDWFFDGALKTEKGVDFALKKPRTSNDALSVRVKNNSDFAAPVGVDAYVKDSIVETRWSMPFSHDTSLSLTNTAAMKWRIAKEIPDYYGLNDQRRRSGLLPGISLKLKTGFGYGKHNAAEIYVLPAIGYNEYDGFMVGLFLHNLSVPQNRFRYTIAGLYGTRSRDFVGAGSIGYWIYPGGVFSEIVPQVDVKTFNYAATQQNIATPLYARYLKLAPSLSFTFRNSMPLSQVTRRLQLKAYSIWEEGFNFNLDAGDSLYKASPGNTQQSTYGRLRYSHENGRTLNPFSYALEGQIGKDFAKLSIEGNLRIDYNIKGKGLHLRGYAGKFFSRGNNALVDDRYLLTTNFTGSNDYLYDGCYFGRTEREGLLSRQVGIQEGGQKIPTPLYGFPLGKSDDWLVGINLKSDLPFGSLPIRVYLDAGTYANAVKVNPSGNRFLYSAGLELHAIQNIILVHIPILVCTDYDDYLKSMYPDNKFAKSISFSVQLQNINWLRTVTNSLRELM